MCSSAPQLWRVDAAVAESQNLKCERNGVALIFALEHAANDIMRQTDGMLLGAVQSSRGSYWRVLLAANWDAAADCSANSR